MEWASRVETPVEKVAINALEKIRIGFFYILVMDKIKD